MYSGYPLCVVALEAFCDGLWPSHSEPYGLTARPVTLLRALRRLVAILLWPLARKQAASGDRMAH